MANINFVTGKQMKFQNNKILFVKFVGGKIVYIGNSAEWWRGFGIKKILNL